MPNKLFSGELMTCKNCGWQFKSTVHLESMWTIIQVDQELIYYCPFCWGIPRHQWPKQVQEKWDKDHGKN